MRDRILGAVVRILGAVGVLCGGLPLLRAYRGGGPIGSGAFRNGQIAGLSFAVLLVLVGGYYLIRGKRSARS
jgi:hypothetical protein